MQAAIEPGTRRRTRKPRKTEFRIDELPEEVRERVLDEHRYRNVEDDNFWAEFVTEDFKEKLETVGFEVQTGTEGTAGGKTLQRPTIYWSGFCCQGDGASFEASVDLDKYIRAHLEDLIKAGIDIFTLRAILNNDPSKSDWEAETPSITRSGHYYHDGTMDISFNWNGDPPKEVGAALEQLRDYILEDARDLAKGYYKALEAEYDYLTGDEAIIESMNANDKKFTRDGDEI